MKKVISAVLVVPDPKFKKLFPVVNLKTEDGEVTAITIKDNDLFDAWSYHDDMGDINIWIDEDDNGVDVVQLAVYPEFKIDGTYYNVPLSGELEEAKTYYKK